MFCPECKAEYVDGITECADCHVPLVWSLPVENAYMEQGEPIEWVPLLSSINQADLAFIKSILESENILFWVQGENRGMIPHGLAFGAVIHVEKNRLEDAKALIKDIDLNNFAFSTRTGGELD